VSRFHARLWLEGGQWRIADLKSRWGTFVNGVALSPHRQAALADGDLVRIAPWTFLFTTSPPGQRGAQSTDDLGQMQTLVRTLGANDAAAMGDPMLPMLLESAARIHGALDEHELARVVVEEAQRATGLPNAAWLKPVDASRRINIVAQVPPSGSAQFSRSMLSAASGGVVAQLCADQTSDVSASIVRLGITSALCVPVVLAAPDSQGGATVAAFVYLDRRGSGGIVLPSAGAVSFCLALARMAGMALANILRLEMARRAALIDAELRAAAQAQQLILPRRMERFGPFTCLGQSRPGRFLAGDFYDWIALGEGRLALTLGDVCGKGVAASVLMTAAQGFLHASLLQHGDPERAADGLNRYLAGRLASGAFVTLWVGVLDSLTRRLRYVDCGHGYALLRDAQGAFTRLDLGENLPIGVDAQRPSRAQSVELPASGRAIVVSDGAIEQPAAGSTPSDRQAFGLEGVRRAIDSCGPAGDEIASLFAAIESHAGGDALADDATAIAVRW
jgi:serine phosphatase RsbU (regulator of sigma subunit)